MLPKLALNRQFMSDFITAELPCCALGMIEERNEQRGLLALRLNDTIPHEVLNKGFRFGHTLLGTSLYEVVHFAFEFYDYKVYNVLINPNDPMVQKVLDMMIESRDYFILLINKNNNVTAFRSDISEEALTVLKDNMFRIKNSMTTDLEYQRALAGFKRNPQPSGEVLNWVCRNNMAYLDINKDRLELSPSK